MDALYKRAVHVIANHYIAATPWAAFVQNHIGAPFRLRVSVLLLKLVALPLRVRYGSVSSMPSVVYAVAHPGGWTGVRKPSLSTYACS